jgi:hypothetical protein
MTIWPRAQQLACLTVVALSALATIPAKAASSKVTRACASDARRFCPSDKKDSPSLRYCMEAKAEYLSKTCVRALEDAGEVPRGYLKGH